MADNIVRYGSRTFSDIKTDLISMIKETYPEVLSDFNDSNVGSMMIDLNAGVSNSLSINTDRVYQETVIDFAQQKSSIINIARNMGFNIPPKRPSVTVVEFSVQVPPLGNSPHPEYLPVLSSGAQIIGGGKTFETVDVVDFSMYDSNLIKDNKTTTPNYDTNHKIESYTITKKEVVTNGTTTYYKKTISSSDIVPFFQLTLPDPDVIEIESVVLNESASTSPDYYNDTNRFYEVDYLAQQSVFVEDTSKSTSDIKSGKWIDVTKKFIREYTTNGYCVLTFGSGDPDVSFFKDGLIKQGVTSKSFLDNYLNNIALGEKLKANYTVYVKYRIGGGSSSNVGTNVLTQMGNYQLTVNGSNNIINDNVKRTLKVTNIVPAIGGNDGLSTEQIRQLVKYNFSGQNRCVTLPDYLVQIYKMNGRFGSPYRANTHKENNKVVISILGIGSDGKLSNSSNSVLKDNMCEYLSRFRSLNDYVEVKDGRIINLSFEIKLYVKNTSDTQIANNIIRLVSGYFDISKEEMNQDIFLGALEKEILGINGVINTISTKIFNKVGNLYSVNTISQELLNTTTREIKVINNTLYSDGDSMFEIKYPEKDISVILVKTVE